jgi:Cu-processing system ATP-binding protein
MEDAMKVIGLREVSVRFGAVQALTNVSVEARSGELVLLAGPNGAGKSTLARVLLGLVRPQRGGVYVNGVSQPVNNAFKSSLGYLPEAVAFSENLRGRQVLGFFARARGVPRGRIDELLERVGLRDAARRSVRGYSRGMRQRLGLAVALLADPELLILDEPSGGLDSEGLSVLSSVLDEWRERGRMVLMTSHQLTLFERRVDRVYVFKRGRVLASGAPAKLRDAARLPEVVHVALTDRPDPAGACLEALSSWAGAPLTPQDSSLSIRLEHSRLMSLMGVLTSHADAITDLRVEEPTLDAVYQRLLEAA